MVIPPKRRTKVSSRRRQRRRHTSNSNHTFQSYLTFGLHATSCIGCFLMSYGLVLICLIPMLDKSNQITNRIPVSPLEGAHLPQQPERIVVAEKKIVEAASALKARFQNLRRGQGTTDEELMKIAKEEYDKLRGGRRRNKNKISVKNNKKKNSSTLKTANRGAAMKKGRSGFVVLGMHRSGTSMLSGLLVTGMGYNAGGPLIQPAYDNKKGFFERIDVVLQNDEFFNHQQMGWSYNVINYNDERALHDKKDGQITFNQGRKALAFLNNDSNAPWLQKDPRMCITLRTWLTLLSNEPAVVFTYRHPFEVAMSLKKRENFALDHSLRLWIVYNMRAIQNSDGLCRVLSSNDDLLSDPMKEVQRISDELTSKCKLPTAPRKLSQADVDKFVDPKLQHSKGKQKEADNAKLKLLADYDGCKVRDIISEQIGETSDGKREADLYLKAMKIYCDFKNGKAYENGYTWPEMK